jgi:hypothetical protein
MGGSTGNHLEEKLNSLFFRDQKNALAFCTEVLGFEKKAEILFENTSGR